VGICHADNVTLSAKFGANFTDMQLLLGRYCILGDSGHGVFFSFHLFDGFVDCEKFLCCSHNSINEIKLWIYYGRL
jgi:hypothetical protein